jgi:hypothetical protein
VRDKQAADAAHHCCTISRAKWKTKMGKRKIPNMELRNLIADLRELAEDDKLAFMQSLSRAGIESVAPSSGKERQEFNSKHGAGNVTAYFFDDGDEVLVCLPHLADRN